MEPNPRGDLIVHVNIACGILSTTTLILRCLARWKSNASFAADDWCILAALVPCYGMLISSSLMVTKGGGGRHEDSLSQYQLITFLQSLNACSITYIFTVVMVKISILLLYRRLFTTPASIFRKTTIGAGVVVCCWGIVALFGVLFQCHHVPNMWNIHAIGDPHQCYSVMHFLIGILIPHLLLDILVLCMPLPIVWNLKIPTSQKFMLSGLFTLGSLSCIASLVRLLSLREYGGLDFTYTVHIPYIWSQIEPTTAIMCACLTTCRPLIAGISLRSLKPLSWSSSRSNSSSPKDNWVSLPESAGTKLIPLGWEERAWDTGFSFVRTR